MLITVDLQIASVCQSLANSKIEVLKNIKPRCSCFFIYESSYLSYFSCWWFSNGLNLPVTRHYNSSEDLKNVYFLIQNVAVWKRDYQRSVWFFLTVVLRFYLTFLLYFCWPCVLTQQLHVGAVLKRTILKILTCNMTSCCSSELEDRNRTVF